MDFLRAIIGFGVMLPMILMIKYPFDGKNKNTSRAQKALSTGNPENYENGAQVIGDKPHPTDPMMSAGVISNDLNKNMAFRGAKILAGAAAIAGAPAIVAAAKVAQKGSKIAAEGSKLVMTGAKTVDEKLGVRRKINGAQWFVKGMKYKVSDGADYIKNNIANSKIGKASGVVIKGVKKFTNPILDVAKDGLTLAASGANGVTFKAQKEQMSKMQKLKEEARKRNRKISQMERSAYESVNAEIGEEKRKILNRYAKLDKSRNRMMQKLANKKDFDGVDNLEATIYKAEKKKAKELREAQDKAMDLYKARISPADAANLRGYNKGARDLTKIASAVTAGTAGFILGNLNGMKSQMSKILSNRNNVGYYAPNNSRIYNIRSDSSSNSSNVNGNVYNVKYTDDRSKTVVSINDNTIVAESNNANTILKPTINAAIKMDEIKEAIKVAREEDLSLKQSMRFIDLQNQAEFTRAQQIENGEKKPLNVEEMKKYFKAAVKNTNSSINKDDLLKIIEDADRMHREDSFKLENRARKQADYMVNVNSEAKEALEKLLSESSQTREIFEKVVEENMNKSKSQFSELERGGKDVNSETTKERNVEMKDKIQEMAPKIVDEVIDAVKNSEHSEKAKQLLGEEGYKQFEESVKEIMEKNEQEFARRLENVNTKLDQEFLKASKLDHPEYSELDNEAIRDLRQENERERYVKKSLNKVQINEKPTNDNPIVDTRTTSDKVIGSADRFNTFNNRRNRNRGITGKAV